MAIHANYRRRMELRQIWTESHGIGNSVTDLWLCKFDTEWKKATETIRRVKNGKTVRN